mgnify:CR=1 FL=1
MFCARVASSKAQLRPHSRTGPAAAQLHSCSSSEEPLDRAVALGEALHEQVTLPHLPRDFSCCSFGRVERPRSAARVDLSPSGQPSFVGRVHADDDLACLRHESLQHGDGECRACGRPVPVSCSVRSFAFLAPVSCSVRSSPFGDDSFVDDAQRVLVALVGCFLVVLPIGPVLGWLNKTKAKLTNQKVPK